VSDVDTLAMKFCILSLVAGVACLCSSAVWPSPRLHDIPFTAVNERVSYDSIDEAAIAALTAVSHPFSRYEFGGMIVERDGRFYFTEAVSTHSVDSVTFRKVKVAYEKVVAVYHTHPIPASMLYDSASLAMRFSPADAEYVKASGFISYIADSRTRTVRRLDPKSLPDNVRPDKSALWGTPIAKLPLASELVVASKAPL
jgi:hypothetical protein